MKHRALLVCIVAALTLLGATIVPAGAGQEQRAPGSSTNAKLQMYEAVVDPATASTIVAGGYDVVTMEAATGELVRLVLVLYPWDRQALEKLGVDLQLWTNGSGLTATQLAAKQASAGFKVWRDYDDPTRGFEAYMAQVAAANPALLDLYDIGTTHQGRKIWALRLTKESVGGDKPAVLYSSLQHAREWISSELNRRLLDWYLKRYREGDKQIRNLLSTTELWFVLVANPDGYQYTFEGDRLWRKNLRNNDGDPDPAVDALDGVDPNRNFPEHFGYDDEGSSPDFSSETYRGPKPGSEPETQAMMAVYALADPVFHVNYHSFGELLLYTFGSQVQTPSADDPIFVALSGTDKKPAIQNFNPGVGADLYITNGETTDWAHGDMGSLAWTPELSEGPNGDGFIFPDSEGAVNNEFRKNRPFALDVALSAADPDDPHSYQGRSTEPFYLDVSTIDLQKAYNPLSDFSFAYSYGDPQPVEILAKRDLNDDGQITSADDVFVHWSVNGGPKQTDDRVPLADWDGGDRFGGTGDVYYRIVRGEVTGFSDGDSVEVWFTGGGHTSDSFTFESITTEPNEVLILAAEDYSGAANIPAYASTTAPNYLAYYESSLDAAVYSTDVYDVDAMGRIAPDHLGVLSHYDAVVWYGANDYLTREPGQAAGTGASTLANAEVLEVRSYLNEGGALLYTGVHAGWQFYNAFEYNPVSTPPYCDGTIPNSTGVECLLLSDDFHQYWLGGYLLIEDGGTDSKGEPFGIGGVDGGAFAGQSWTLNGPDSADNHHPNPVRGTTFSLLTTSSLQPPDTYPQFTSHAQAEWVSPNAGAFSPLSGDFYAYSDRGDISYKRLVAELDVPDPASGDTTLEFSVSYDTEPAWDFVFVEARTPGGTDYITLADLNGHTSSSTGDSCPEGWHDLHPHLALYQGADCSGTGWNAASGRSAGWETWSVDLGDWAGSTVEVSISYASDWAIQGLGAFVDDIAAPGAPVEGFQSGLGAWAPADGTDLGSAPNPSEWFRTEDVGFEEGAAVSMSPPGAPWRTLYFAFGFEGITDQAQRDAVMADAIAYLLGK